jgi:N-acetylglucosaminyldiphosphoundecaprenol N-acetyl-beta-D-mannosaminyltransferase
VSRVLIGDLPVDAVTLPEALAVIAQMVEGRAGGTVFTPNVDHVVLARQSDKLRRAYAAVDLSVPDGMPIVWASRLLGTPLPEKVSGSDLVPALMSLAEAMNWRVYLLGGGKGIAARAALRLRTLHPHLHVVGCTPPLLDPERPGSIDASVQAVHAAAPDLVLVALGAPKQELWIQAAAQALRPAVLLGVGASLDFLAGSVSRAPAWVSAAGLEWAYRLAREPRRLWRRYLVRDPRFLLIVAEELLGHRRSRQRERTRRLRAASTELRPVV